MGGLSIKNFAVRGGDVSSPDIFEQGVRDSSDATSALFGAKTSKFSKLMACPHEQGGVG